MLHVALNIVLIILSLGVIATVLFQSGRSAGLSGSISGGAETFLGKRGMDDQLAKASAVFSVLFMIVAFVITMILK